MKKAGLIFSLFILGFTFSANADYRVYLERETFEENEWQHCVAATDWCNNYTMREGKVFSWTKMHCAWHIQEWTCTKYEEWIMTTMSLPNQTENDLNFHDTIMDRLDDKYINWVDNTIKKYNSLTSNLSNSKRHSLKNSLMNKIDNYLFKITMSVPQDTKMPDNINNAYLMLNLLKLKLQIQ